MQKELQEYYQILFKKCFKYWGNAQIDMILEESAELMSEINKLNHFILKYKRENKNISPNQLITILSRDYQTLPDDSFMANIINELADYHIMLSQFFPRFEEKLFEMKKFKITRLVERLNKYEQL